MDRQNIPPLDCGPSLVPPGGRAIKGAPENTRNVMAAQWKYMKSILSTGINLDFRGTPTGDVDGSNDQVVFLLGGKQYPTNANVIAMREKGYTVLMRSVRNWIMRQHNSKHEGCKITNTVMLNVVTTAESSWAAYCADKKVTSRGCATKGEYTYAKHVRTTFRVLSHTGCCQRLQAGECIQM